MTHYPVLVCLPAGTDLADVEAALEQVLAPWDENRAVPAYRRYEQGPPSDFWALPHLRARGWKLPESEPSWRQVASAFNAECGFKKDPSRRLVVDGDGGAYTMSTYNPESRWDWWVVGGRWQRHFIAVPSATAGQLIIGQPGSAGDNGAPLRTSGLRCDGGPRRLLDFAAMRQMAEAAAQLRYDRWEAVCVDTPTARPLSDFRGLVAAGELSSQQAREQYSSQPRIVAAGRAGLLDWLACPVEEFGDSREDYLPGRGAPPCPATPWSPSNSCGWHPAGWDGWAPAATVRPTAQPTTGPPTAIWTRSRPTRSSSWSTATSDRDARSVCAAVRLRRSVPAIG